MRRIASSRRVKGRHELNVEWTGYDQSDNTWVAREILLEDVPLMLAAYEANAPTPQVSGLIHQISSIYIMKYDTRALCTRDKKKIG